MDTTSISCHGHSDRIISFKGQQLLHSSQNCKVISEEYEIYMHGFITLLNINPYVNVSFNQGVAITEIPSVDEFHNLSDITKHLHNTHRPVLQRLDLDYLKVKEFGYKLNAHFSFWTIFKGVLLSSLCTVMLGFLIYRIIKYRIKCWKLRGDPQQGTGGTEMVPTQGSTCPSASLRTEIADSETPPTFFGS